MMLPASLEPQVNTNKILRCVKTIVLDVHVTHCLWHALADEDNEMRCVWNTKRNMVIEVRDVATEIPLTGGYQMMDLVTGWHKHCFTFKAGGSIKVLKYMHVIEFKDHYENEELTLKP